MEVACIFPVDVRGREVIDLGHHPAGQDILGRARCPERMVQQEDALSVLRDVFDVVGGAEEGESPGPLQVTNPPVEPGPGRRIQPGGGFVQDQQAGISDESPGDEDPLLLPPGQVLEPTMAEAGHPHRLQRMFGFFPVRGAGAPEQPQVSVPPHKDHVGHREGKTLRKADALRDISDGLAQIPGRVAQDGDRAAIGPDDAQEDSEEGRFPGTVGSDEGRERPLRYLERDSL